MSFSRRQFLAGTAYLLSSASSAGLNHRALGAPPVAPASARSDAPNGGGYGGWDNDRSYEVRVDALEGQGPERKNIRYIADFLEVSEVETRSIVRYADGPASNVGTLTLDARHVFLNGPLAFSDASVVIVAQKFSYGEDAILALFASQAHSAKIGIFVYEFQAASDPYIKPFDIYYDRDGVGPSVEIYAHKVTCDGQEISAPADASRIIWRLVGASDDTDEPPSDAPVRIVVGNDALTKIDQASSGALWPAAVYEKALRLQSAFPFDDDLRADIRAKQEETRKYLEKTDLAEAASGFPILVARVQDRLDAFGHGPNWAPRKALSAQLDSFGEMLRDMASGAGAGLLSDNLIKYVAAGFDGTQPDQAAVRSLQDRRDKIQADIDDINGSIDANLKATLALNDQFFLLKAAIEQNQVRIQQETLDQEKRLHDAAAAKQGFATVGTVVGLATSFIGTPAAGAAVGAGFNAIGDIVYNHNVGGTLNLATLADILDDTTKFYKSMTEVIDKWKTLAARKSDFVKVMDGQALKDRDGKPITKMDAAKGFGNALADFGKSVNAITKEGKSPVPQPLSLSQKENLDPSLQEYLELLSDNQRKQAELTSELQGLKSKLTSEKAERDQAVAALTTLLDVKPVNDEQFRRWTQWARYLWVSDIRWIVQEIYILQRAFGFEIGKDIPVLSGLSSFPASIAASIDAKYFDVLAPGTFVKGNQVAEHLKEQRGRIYTSAAAVHEACRRGIETYLSKNQRRVTFERAVEFRRNDADLNRRSFIEGLNAQIKLLIGRRRAGYSVARQEPVNRTAIPGSPASKWNLVDRPRLIPLYIPFIFEPPAFPNEAPIRFVRARVASVRWTNRHANLGYDGLNFTVIHPGFGEIGSVENHRFIDLREGNAINEIRNVTTLFQIVTGAHELAPIQPDIGATYYTYPPARTDYYMTVDVTSEHWSRVPEIEELVIVWELFQ